MTSMQTAGLKPKHIELDEWQKKTERRGEGKSACTAGPGPRNEELLTRADMNLVSVNCASLVLLKSTCPASPLRTNLLNRRISV